jgi:hypothetical protein
MMTVKPVDLHKCITDSSIWRVDTGSSALVGSSRSRTCPQLVKFMLKKHSFKSLPRSELLHSAEEFWKCFSSIRDFLATLVEERTDNLQSIFSVFLQSAKEKQVPSCSTMGFCPNFTDAKLKLILTKASKKRVLNKKKKSSIIITKYKDQIRGIC